MRYRRVTGTGDYSFGQSSLDYATDLEAVGQAVQTKLKLLLGEWWEDTADGLPLWQTILQQRATEDGMRTIDLLVQARILETPNVTGIVSYESAVKNRAYQATATIDTTFGQLANQTIALEVG